MGTVPSVIRQILNHILPFTNPATPLIQDLIHTLLLCGTLYYAPALAERYHSQQLDDRIPPAEPDLDNTADHALTDDPPSPNANIPLDERLILQPDSDSETDRDRNINFMPPAPTPPPGPGLAQPPIPFADLDPAEGPAEGPADRPRATPQNRIIGAKKAKSLARKDQRRAYHEFHRQQAEIRRQAEAAEKEEREAELYAEKARRAEVEREIAERERLGREKRKEDEKREADAELRRRERALDTVRGEVERYGVVNLSEVARAEGKSSMWIDKLVRASGIVGSLQRPERGEHTIHTGGMWIVRIDKEIMREVYANAAVHGEKHRGKISFADFGSIIEEAVEARARANS
ncbi:uncharacterized protein BDR25DRAFT_306167 [Lindgomyces ingoldianus]|uniref:Uncharacterized protein n=1 Tax=Lindgomyces ingoldianus TaxID=673940 RepID=A0ACB6QJ49_9PLEO|nr:uncharacterized protein BDR25DRAFT_306167 [Lindgomyces ingoldianus]KAF2466347.1 hypothetical protein BDR25DRAFT_306167 [Lindgomyces ingoldianus]